jgi:phenylalanyl-tRNA synthetase beta chain
MKQITDTLLNVGFEVDVEAPYTVVATPPYWRTDVHIDEDIAEEIGRLCGFDSIMPTLPARDFRAVTPSQFDELRTRVRKLLVRAGANEVLTYSFVHGDVFKKSGQEVENAYRITNSISPDLQHYRQTLTPSLLGLIHMNIKQGFDDFAIFEVNKSHPKSHGLTDEGVPVEANIIALTVTSKKVQSGAPYYRAKTLLDYMANSLGIKLTYTPMTQQKEALFASSFEYRRSALVSDASGAQLGIVGEYKKSVSKAFKLPEYTAGFEIDSAKLLDVVRLAGPGYAPLSKYPSSERDICFQVRSDVSYGQIVDIAAVALRDIELEAEISPVDIYQSDDKTTKNITIRVRLTSRDKTLTTGDVNTVVENVGQKVAYGLEATII